MNDNELFDYIDGLNTYKDSGKESCYFSDDTSDYQNTTDSVSEPINYNRVCYECSTAQYVIEDTAKGIIICDNCGSILNNVYYSNDDVRYNDDYRERSNRCNNYVNYFLPNSSLCTTIACSNNSRVKILHKWGAMPYKERSLHEVLKYIHQKCQQGNIMKCIEDDARILYKNIKDAKHTSGKNKGKMIIIRGDNKESLIAACVLFACKKNHETRSPKEIAKLFDIEYKSMTRGCKKFYKLLSMTSLDYSIEVSDPIHFITRFCRSLHIHKNYIEKCIEITNNIQKLKIASRHTPFSIANSSILLVSDYYKELNIDRKEVSSKFNVSEVTIIKTYKKLIKYRKIIMDTNLTNKIVQKAEIKRKLLPIPEFLINNYYNNIRKKLSNYQINKFNQPDEKKEMFNQLSSKNKNNANQDIIRKNLLDNLESYIKIMVETVDKDDQIIDKRYKSIINLKP